MVSIQFDQDSYTFNENDGTVSVTLSLNREISSNVFVNIVVGLSWFNGITHALSIIFLNFPLCYFTTATAGPADSPFITESGPQINRTVQFTGGDPLTYSLLLMLKDDQNAIEDIESFVLRLESSLLM